MTPFALALLFHVLTIAEMTAAPVCQQTHVEVTGFVRYVAREDDGDLHVRICDGPRVRKMDRRRCVVAECIPALPCSRPRVGARVTVQGISRFDGENGHGWNEVHPVLSLKEG